MNGGDDNNARLLERERAATEVLRAANQAKDSRIESLLRQIAAQAGSISDLQKALQRSGISCEIAIEQQIRIVRLVFEQELERRIQTMGVLYKTHFERRTTERCADLERDTKEIADTLYAKMDGCRKECRSEFRYEVVRLCRRALAIFGPRRHRRKG